MTLFVAHRDLISDRSIIWRMFLLILVENNTLKKYILVRKKIVNKIKTFYCFFWNHKTAERNYNQYPEKIRVPNQNSLSILSKKLSPDFQILAMWSCTWLGIKWIHTSDLQYRHKSRPTIPSDSVSGLQDLVRDTKYHISDPCLWT